MKKYVVLCAISALLGGLLSTALTTHSVEPQLSAQEAPPAALPPVALPPPGMRHEPAGCLSRLRNYQMYSVD